MGVVLIGTLFAPTARAATTVTVTPNNMQGWAFFDDKGNGGTGVMVPGPATPPLGAGSAELAVTALNQGYALGTGAYVGTPLSAITNLSYSSYQPGTVLAIALQFDIKYHTADSTYDGRLVYEPYQNGHVTVGSGWQHWSPLSGIWWASNQTASGGLCPMGGPCSWATVLSTWPQATISGAVLFKAGSGWPSFTGNVDDFTIGVSSSDTTYDFEPGPPCTTDCYVSTTGNDLAGGASFADAKRTIQAAVNQVSSGGTVHVAAGTYAENVDVTKSVTIQGAGQGSTIVEPAVSGPAPTGCGASPLCVGGSSVFLVAADTVHITGLTVEGANPSLALSGVIRGGVAVNARNGIITDLNSVIASNNLVVDNVTVQDIYLRGIEVRGTGFNLTHDAVTNVQGDVNYSVAMFNTGGSGTFANDTVSLTPDAINSNHSKGTQVLDNVVSDSGSGVHTDNAGDGGGTADRISGNTVSNCTPGGPPSAVGIWTFVPYIAPTVTNNTVTNCAIGLGAFGQGNTAGTTSFTGNRVNGGGAGIGAYISGEDLGYGLFAVSATLTGNTFVDGATGVQVVEVSGYPASAVVHYNVIAGNAIGATSNSVGAIDATNNWWGCSGGPGSGCNGVSAKVNANPWLVDALSVSPNLVAAGATSSATVTADLTGNSTPAVAPGTIHDGTPVTFTLVNSSNTVMQTVVTTSSSGKATATFSGLTIADVYSACVQIPTTYGALECAPLVVYDASAGFVTGGGWITSLTGAYKADPTLTGRATFGFVSKYQKGATVPSGHTAFVFKTGNLDFQSTAYQWLVVNQGGTNAQFKGSGTINGAGTYDFMIWATDSSPDKFRIQITDSTTGTTVYDNGPGEAIGGGSIIVHS